MATEPKEVIQDIPSRVIENFLQELEGTGATDEMIARLHQTLIEDKSFTESALKKAIFGKECDQAERM